MTRVAAVIGMVLLAIVASGASAVGLGDITLRSALSEPLDAEIRITNPEDLTASELNVSLASNADFDRAGIERPFFLNQLDFQVTPDGDAFVVSVTTEEAVQEPFLDFLVELQWPGGRLVREYTILLDPPIFDESESATEQVFPSEDPFEEETAEAAGPDVPDVETMPQPEPVSPTTRDEQLRDDQYRVMNNDTLWEIALRARQDPSQSPQQIMLAIQDMNPGAFIDSNINRVRAGRLLNLPDAEQVAIRSRAEAVREVERQNAAFRGAPAPAEAQISGTDDTASGLAPGAGERDPDGFLEVVTEPGEPDETSAAEGESEMEVARLQNELAIQQEINDELRLQGQEQQSRLADLEEQVEMLSRLVEMQSQTAEQLQSAAEQLERQEAELAEQEAAAAAAGESPGPDDGAAEPSGPSTPDFETPLATDDLLDQAVRWITQPYNAAAVLFGVVLLLALANLIRKRRETANEESLEAEDALMVDGDDLYGSGLDDLDGDAGLDEDLLSGDSDVQNPEEAGAAAEAIENAELYMAFQRYDEAENALKTALQQSPGEPSLELKLLELYAETGNRAAFDTLAEQFTGDDSAVNNLREKLQASGGEDDFVGSDPLSDELGDDDFDDLDLDIDLDDEAQVTPAGSAAELADLDDDGLDMDDLDTLDVPELDDPLGLPDEEPATQRVGADQGDDFSVDFQSDNRITDSGRDGTYQEFEDDDELSMDFDLSDLDLDESPDASEEPPASRVTESPAATEQQEEPRISASADEDLDVDFDFGDVEEQSSDDDDPLGDLSLDSYLSEEKPSDRPARQSTPEAPQSASLQGEDDDWDGDFDFLDGADEVATKLDLARAYIDMEDPEGAKDILNEVIEEGSAEQQADARKLLDGI